MPHHGLLNELENDLERLVLSASQQQQQQNGPYMQQQQQPMNYGQGMYGPGAMSYGPAARGMPYQQPVYGMSPQIMQPAFGAQMAPYGQGYIDAGDGQPAMIYGGQYEGPVGMPAGYRQAYPPGSMQGYAQGPQPGYQQAYSPATQLGYPQGYQQASQPNMQPIYRQQVQPGPQQQLYSIASLPPQQPAVLAATQLPAQIASPQSYLTASQSASQPAPQQNYLPASPQPVPQPAAQPTPPQSYVSASPQPAPQATLQQNQPGAIQPSPQPIYSPRPQACPELPCSPASGPPPPPSYTPEPQPTSKAAYPSVSQAANPPGYAPATQPIPQTGYFLASQPVYASGNPTSQFGNPSLQRPPVLVQNPSYTSQRSITPNAQPPVYLNPQDTMVRYKPVSVKADTHHHALKSLMGSAQSMEALTAILGSYLALKQAHEVNHTSLDNVGGYRHARPEVQSYNHTMDKLDSLSTDFIAKHKTVPPAWVAAIGPHRRHIFASLYNSNELVRAFCNEVNGGPLMLPDLDSYGLGKTLSNFSFGRVRNQAPNLNTSLSVLSQVRTVILVDDSGSMTAAGHQSWSSGYGRTETRWMQARNVLAGLAPFVASYNPYGIDLHFLNRVPFYAGLRISAAVQAAFDCDYPSNGTPTGQRVNDILDAYMSTLRHYRNLLPLNLIVITDGEAQDEHILHWTIEHHVTKIVHRGFPAHQFGIEFVQVGDCAYATRHLEKLEEEVSRHHLKFQRDVVGVTPTTRVGNMDGEKLLAIAVSGIDARMNGYMRSRMINV